MSTTDWEGDDVERVAPTEGEEDVPAGSAEEVGADDEELGGGTPGVQGDLGGGGWTESGGATESGAEVGGGMGERPADAGAMGTETGGGTPRTSGAGDLGSEEPDRI